MSLFNLALTIGARIAGLVKTGKTIRARFGSSGFSTDGKTINIVGSSMADDPDWIKVVMAGSNHEIAHVRYTDFSVPLRYSCRYPQSIVHQLAHGFEDPRVEYRLICDLPGTRTTFVDGDAVSVERNSIRHADSSDLLSAATLYGIYRKTEQLFPERNCTDYYEHALKVMSDAFGFKTIEKVDALLDSFDVETADTEDAYSFAECYLDLLQMPEQDDGGEDNTGKNDGSSDDSEGSDDQEKGGDSSCDSDRKNDQNDDENQSSPGNDDDSDSDSDCENSQNSDDDSTGSDGSNNDSDDGNDQDSDDGQDSSGNNDDSDSDSDSENNQDGDDDSTDSDGSNNDSDDENDQDSDDDFDNTEAKDQLSKQISDQKDSSDSSFEDGDNRYNDTVDAMPDDSSEKAKRGRGATDADVDYFPNAQEVSPVSSIDCHHGARSMMMSDDLAAILEAKSNRYREAGLKEGLLDLNGIHRIATGEGDVFYRNAVESDDGNTIVGIMLDMSASMSNHQYLVQAEAASLLIEALDGIPNVESYVVGMSYTSHDMDGYNHYVAKRPGDELHIAKRKIAGIPQGGGTPLLMSTVSLCQDILSEPDFDKHVGIVITDGDYPSSYREQFKSLEQSVDLFGIGLGADLSNIFTNQVKIDDVDELPRTLVGMMTRYFED